MKLYVAIDLGHNKTIQKSHNASDELSTMHHFVTEICTHMRSYFTKYGIVGNGTGAWRDMCNRPIGSSNDLAVT